MRFSYVQYAEQAAKNQQELKAAFEGLEALVNKLADGRAKALVAKALVYTKLEEAYMQIKRNGSAPEQPNRNNE